MVAEDLGVVTADVEALRDHFGLPGMKILQFAFDGNPENPYLPANIHGDRWVVYTGTHDNPTTIGNRPPASALSLRKSDWPGDGVHTPRAAVSSPPGTAQ